MKRSPLYIPDDAVERLERFPKHVWMDVAWALAARVCGEEDPGRQEALLAEELTVTVMDRQEREARASVALGLFGKVL